MRSGNVVSRICLSVRNAFTVKSLDIESSFFGMQVQLQNI